jgi:hypothetical protein
MNAGINLYLAGMNNINKKPVKIERKAERQPSFIEINNNKKDVYNLKDAIKIENIKSERECVSAQIKERPNKKELKEVNQKIEDFDYKLKQHSENILDEVNKFNINKRAVNERVKPNKYDLQTPRESENLIKKPKFKEMKQN